MCLTEAENTDRGFAWKKCDLLNLKSQTAHIGATREIKLSEVSHIFCLTIKNRAAGSAARKGAQMDVDTFSIYDTRLRYTNETDRGIDAIRGWLRKKFQHYGYFYRILHRLGREGFAVEQDPETRARYKKIAKDHWYGRRGDLEFVAKKYPNGFEIEFFQNVIHKNQNGGRYDFDKLEKMPYLIRLQYTKYMRIVVDMLKYFVEVKDITKPVGKTAEEKIVIDLSCNFRMLPDKDFDIHILDGTDPGEGYGWGGYPGVTKDRDGKDVKNGDVKYFRQWYTGRLMRGRVYYRANQQFWAITDKNNVELVQSARELFDPTPEDFRQPRKAPDRAPDDYKKRRAAIDETKNGELIAELRRRGLKVRIKNG